ncbi:MAG: class II aldolase/adducin family protein [Promethearchaeota archaeon]
MNSIKEELIKYSNLLSEKNMVIGPGGNTSVRIGEYMYIKPSGVSFTEMGVEDLVEVEISSGNVTPHQKGYKPSSEVLMHLYLYQIRDIKCIFHAHPPMVNGLVSRNVEIKHIFPDSVVYLGKNIKILEYCTPCGEDLAQFVKKNMSDELSLILKNHGAITVGENPKVAFTRMDLLEGLAYTEWIALSSGASFNEISFLTENEIEEILNLESEKYRQKLVNYPHLKE